VTVHSGGRTTIGKMDLYRKGAFILEAKQGSDAGALKLGTARRGTSSWAVEMERAFGQAIAYAQTLDDRPPFLIVCDIGYCFDLYASFDGSPYRPFPDARNRRLFLSDLPTFVGLLRQVWSDPRSLDPSLRKARVTRTIAGHLAELAQQLERRGHDAQRVAKFLMRCLFTMFAEDAGLLPPDVFKDALEKHWRTHPDRFAPELESLWLHMDRGGYQFGLGKILKFNGALFAEAQALPLERPELDLLYRAALCDWRDVEPAIFGTLLEQALDPTERHALGADYTPRPYVERLVRPTVEEPLRAEWEAIRAAAVAWVGQGKEAQARETVGAFHLRLCELRVLDPACGTGNFLYVALDLLKRLEGEVLELLQDLGDTQAVFGRRVGPRQFLGIEKKPWAREIADLVLWVGYLSAQLRNLGKGRQIAEPVLEKLDNIQCRDAVLTWTSEEPLLDAQGQPLSRWDGVTTKKHPITGEDVPDDSARVPLTRLIDPDQVADTGIGSE
ncbi:MAG TPA: class I SAM-dependent DNA methyltransferase, partial [Myxococcota bacterium]|nr:class I SAM-dependent DNA methyltransferase [Myxococcota bacterium]